MRQNVLNCCGFAAYRTYLIMSEEKHGRSDIWAKFCGCLAPALIPPCHIAVLYYFWDQFSRTVDKRYCSCSCWDTVFKGTYESGIASYKHMYFNATSNTTKIWILTVTCIIALYESIRHLMSLVFKRRLRTSMLILFSCSIFSNYYAWWSYLNYWNDEFYSQWNHQLFFTCTEIASTALILHLANEQNPVTVRKALGIASIAVLHVMAGGFDQFIGNVLRGEGYRHQVIRDLGFMIPDLLNLLLPLIELRRNRKLNFLDKELRRELLFIGIFVSVGFVVCSYL